MFPLPFILSPISFFQSHRSNLAQMRKNAAGEVMAGRT